MLTATPRLQFAFFSCESVQVAQRRCIEYHAPEKTVKLSAFRCTNNRLPLLRQLGKTRVVADVGKVVLPEHLFALHQEQARHLPRVADRLAGEAIPLSARIMALVDVYDALRARRPYKEPFSHERALTIIDEENGRLFDPRLVQAFRSVQHQFDTVCQRLADSMWFAS